MYHVDDNWTLMDLIKASFASWFCGVMVSTLETGNSFFNCWYRTLAHSEIQFKMIKLLNLLLYFSFGKKIPLTAKWWDSNPRHRNDWYLKPAP